MKVYRTISGIKRHLTGYRPEKIGFVPTMGALHEGHISLVEKAVKLCPVVVVSIFVNPTQFNDKEDLKKYPRTEDADLGLLQKVMRENDAVFIPEVEEMYPAEDNRVFDFGNLGKVMEGLHRPGHFNGVAQVVTKLFDIVEPGYAFFGQKDFQQLAIVKELMRQTGSSVQIISCPIVRESDGLAMSSRNRLLEPEIRKNAGIIFRTLKEAVELAGKREIPEIKKYVERSINSTRGFSLEYFEIVDDKQLRPVTERSQFLKENNYFCCIALRAGKIRLIDNMEISLL